MNSKAVFYFKKFEVRHSASSMKVGTDAVLLGAWANTDETKVILDIGTGCGVIALMLAQRTSEDAIIDAIDIDEQSCEEAYLNFTTSPWPDKLGVVHTSLQNFHSEKHYDLIVSNPPYFTNSYKPERLTRIHARHTTQLDALTLISAVKKLLHKAGKFCVVLPFTEGLEFSSLCRANGLYCTRKFSVRGRTHKPIERWLLEFQFEEKEVEQGEIIIHDVGDAWAASYRALTKDFYLKN
ncbi:MAG TPA: methyltransferase [Cyclobacteriaceae bacterium]|nr:methyltransferase [Cyclobacteriaceae bacterium]